MIYHCDGIIPTSIIFKEEALPKLLYNRSPCEVVIRFSSLFVSTLAPLITQHISYKLEGYKSGIAAHAALPICVFDGDDLRRGLRRQGEACVREDSGRPFDGVV